MRTREEQRNYLLANPDQVEKKRARQYARSKTRPSVRWKVFGGTIELFNYYWRKQKGCCGICGRKLRRRGEQGQQASIAQFDHCHDSLRPRGILCMQCNVKLDWYIEFKEEIEEYLQ